MTAPRWTVVQHSGWGYRQDAGFRQDLETRRVPYRRDQEAVTKAGGLLFDSYDEAEAYAEKEAMRGSDHPLIAKAPGTFAALTIDQLAVYVPPALEHRFVVTVSGVTADQAENLMRHEFGRGAMPQRREVEFEGGPPVVVEIDWGWESCT